MGGKSRKTGGVSKRLIQTLTKNTNSNGNNNKSKKSCGNPKKYKANNNPGFFNTPEQ